MDFTAIAKEVHTNALAHGWWDDDRCFGELIALCHSELSEALEENRAGHDATEPYYSCKKNANVAGECAGECHECQYGKPEGIPSELADCVIRIMDIAEHYGINLEAAIIEKHEFNKTRPYKHGKRY